MQFDPILARYAGDILRRLVKIVSVGAEQTTNLVPAIQLLHNVILRLDLSSSTLTTTHHAFLRLCLLARAYADAAHILDRPLYFVAGDIDRQFAARTFKYLCSEHESSSIYLNPATGLSGRLNSRMYLEYHLLAAMCYMALRRYSRAIFFLEAVLIAPAAPNAISRVMIEAYKKWVLLGILVYGEPPHPPKSLGPANLRNLKALAKPYECVADAFRSGNPDRLRGEIHEGQQFWMEDSNNGLVLEVFNAFRRFAVLKLEKTFTALSIIEVARRTSPDPNDLNETLQYITSLIQQGKLEAQITPSPADGVPTLRFLPSPSKKKSEFEISKELTSKIMDLQSLLKQVANNDHKLEVNKDYIDLLRKLKKTREQAEIEGVNVAKNTMMEIDEEMMADL